MKSIKSIVSSKLANKHSLHLSNLRKTSNLVVQSIYGGYNCLDSQVVSWTIRDRLKRAVMAEAKL